MMSHWNLHRYALLAAVLGFGVPRSQAQWPTSTLTDSALSINYGFEAGATVFDDGSVTFCHGFDRWQFLTRFDARGYSPWTNPVLINNHDSAIGGYWPMVSDGARGVIMILGDQRGATFDSVGNIRTTPVWMQRVDSNGAEQWGAGGVLAARPDSTLRSAWLTTDGAGGAMLTTMESSWLFPEAQNFSRLRVRRINSQGDVLWTRTLDSSANINLYIRVTRVSRAGSYMYIDGERFYQPQISTNLTRIIDTSGTISPLSPWLGYFENVPWRDSVLFSASSEGPHLSRMKKVDPTGQILWNVLFDLPDSGCQGSVFTNTSTIPDGLGGVFALYSCRDTIYHFRDTGEYTRPFMPAIGTIRGYAFSDEAGGLVIAGVQGRAQRYRASGEPMWGGIGITYRADPQNAYFPHYWGDRNGGIIATMWTTSRGLCAQHTGRNGDPGVVPVLNEAPYAFDFVLYQNYPNPFNPRTRIRFVLQKRGRVELTVFDIAGRKIECLVDAVLEGGLHEIDWDARGSASGVYFCRMAAGDNVSVVKKMLLVR